ncbi:MFS transporter [Endozoicomonas sp. G2_2]|uniref:CynX/NimT family MFS transporter n=1 Tax=Endozoicomonas sp. G2_2 TaxID=2821092 RepID=UPI001ADB4D20|nr:MFS transporter [Endozoicomonas sp. G2_2]MBO9468675.1 MFS transporter [Endozoicomonas sp. G2_2]
MSRTRPARHVVLMLLGLILVGLNLRPALTSVSPVLVEIGRSLGLGSMGQGVLTTLPVLCLGLAAPLAPRAARRIGDETTILLTLGVLALALLVRPWSGVVGLFAGTALAGGCIGVMGVLLPGLVKRDFPDQVGVMTGLYTMALCTGASIAAGATEPLRLLFAGEWRWALTFWLTPAIVAGLVWLPQLARGHPPAPRRTGEATRLRTSRLAWQVTLFMGLQSSLAYSVFGWLPTILHDRGLSEVDAGLMLSLSIIVQLISAIAAPWIGGRCRDQRGVVVAVMLLTLAGLLGCLYASIESVALWAVVLGLGQGGTFSMGLTLIALRAADSRIAAELSGMAQGIGYVLAALGPLLVGILHDLTGGWQSTGVLFGVIVGVGLIAGLGAGRDLQVGAVPEPGA